MVSVMLESVNIKTMIEDTRGPNQTIHAALVKAEIPIETKALDAGDYAWEDYDHKKVGVERKTWQDLLASFADGRLGGTDTMKDGVTPKDELQRLKSAYIYPVLLIEGMHLIEAGKICVATDEGKWIAMRDKFGVRSIPFIRTKWAAARIYSSLWDYSRYLGVEVVWTPNARASGELLVHGYLHDQRVSHGNERKSTRWKAPGVPHWYDFIHLPGVGAVRWQALDKSANSLYNVSRMSEKEIQVVVGKVTGTKIWRWLHG